MKKHFLSLTLIILGLILNFVFSGHDYIAYALYLIAALIAASRFMGRRLRMVICIILAICLAYFVIIEIPIIGASSGDKDFEADYIIVLGALVRGKEPSLSMIERTQAALDYMNKHPDTMVIVSGGQGDMEDISEAEAMYRWLVDNGADESRILLEDKSTSTLENLTFSFDIIRQRGDDPAEATAVVTSEYHIYRAKLLGRDLGVELGGISAHTTYFSVRVNYYIREAFGVTYKWLFS
ncbi:MAG: YdcF family protein [Bacillota bacterium]|nr:YdcF family protein [Bacillota bacterium]